MPRTRLALGAQGEAATAAWYIEQGWSVLDRNWRCREGEIDLVVRRGERIVFCEVKTRTTDRFGGGAAAVTPVKQARIRKLAMRWLASHSDKAGAVRFDVAVVESSGVRVIEGAF